MRPLAVVLVAVLTGCGAEQSEQSAQPPESEDSEALVDTSAADLRAEREHGNPNPMLYRMDAHPFGRSVIRWSEKLWGYIYGQPIDQSPFLDTTGANCGVGQEGPVWFLPSVPGSSLGTTVTRHCAIPKHKAIILQLASAMNDYPCPDPAFQPAPGQSLYDFLLAPIHPLFDGETGFTVTLDGVEVKDPLSYRFTSKHVFHFKGDISLFDSGFDTCVTGKRQEGVSDGFYLMFKPLDVGRHTIVVTGHDMEGTAVTLTEHLTIR